MRNIFIRLARAVASLRPYSTGIQAQFGIPSRPIKTSKYVQRFQEKSKDPLWPLLELLHTPERDDGHTLASTLSDHGFQAEECEQWQDIVRQPDIESALAALRAKGYLSSTDTVNGPPIPPVWLIFYLAGYKVRTPLHATNSLQDLVWGTIEHIHESRRASLLVFTMLHLSRFCLLVPMRRTVDAFLTTPLSYPTLQINLFLQVLAEHPVPSIENADLVVKILTAMDSRRIKLLSATYDSLLDDRFVTLQLTKYLQEKMTREGVVPTAQQLEAYLNVFAKNGAIHHAYKYYQAIHATKADKIDHDDSCSGPENDCGDPDVNDKEMRTHRATTRLLAAQVKRAAAFEFLLKLTRNEPPSPRDTSRITPASSIPTAHTSLPLPLHERHRVPALSTPRILHKKTIDIYDYTAALTVAARDPSTTPHQLVKIFRRSHKGALGILLKPTIVTYTVFLRGLYARKSFKLAEKYWRKLRGIERRQRGHGGKLRMDREALAIGLQILTRTENPHEAFHTLELYTRPEPQEDTEQLRDYRPIKLSPVSMNDFFVSLNRISRPDIVFKLWDHMTPLFNVAPDSRTFCILLQSVRLAVKLDDTLAGAMAQLALKNPFRRVPKPPETREERIHAIQEVVGSFEGGLRVYQNGIWNDQTPFEVARRIFLQVVWGVCPPNQLDELYSVLELPPARAIRETADADPMTSLGIPHHLLKPLPAKFDLPPDLLDPKGKPWYPNVLLTDSICFNYLMLLGVCERAIEIPYVLGWMKVLGIEPSRSTLALALVLWAEVSVLPPLMESWQQRQQRSSGVDLPVGEYEKLMVWIGDWLGKDKIPTDDVLVKWVTILNKIRKRDDEL